MLTQQDLINSMINLTMAFRKQDPDIYYYYVELMRHLYQFAHENDIHICDIDLDF